MYAVNHYMITAKQSYQSITTITILKCMSNDDSGRCYDIIVCSKYTSMYCRYVESLKLIALQTNILDIDDDDDFLV